MLVKTWKNCNIFYMAVRSDELHENDEDSRFVGNITL